MPSIFPISLGCPKNLTDTEEMLGLLQARGYRIITGEPPADIALINTCAFIATAVQEAHAELEKLIALKKQGYFGKIVVAGCLVQRERQSGHCADVYELPLIITLFFCVTMMDYLSVISTVTG
jgi:ribosomal protein S12 methylthiotransferase